jgi:hypothetical protein
VGADAAGGGVREGYIFGKPCLVIAVGLGRFCAFAQLVWVAGAEMRGWAGYAVAGLEVFFQFRVGVLRDWFCVKIGFEHVVWPSENGGPVLWC